MPKPAHIIVAAAVFAIALCDAAELIRDGSTKEKAIRLKQHGMKAVEEEMQWMMKLYHYTPVLATRDAVANAVRQIKAGKKKNVQNLHPWEHGSLDDHGRLISYWSLRHATRQERDLFRYWHIHQHSRRSRTARVGSRSLHATDDAVAEDTMSI
jgi:hypothetical protein